MKKTADKDILMELRSFTDIEIHLKKYYTNNNNICSLEYFIETIKRYYNNSTNLFPIVLQHLFPTNLELTEDIFASVSNDVILLKHPCYSPNFTHLHTFFEIIYVLEGSCSNIIDNNNHVMHTGDLCIIPPKVYHSILCTSDSVIMNILIRTSTFGKSFLQLLKYSNIISEFFNEILYSNTYKKYLMFHTPEESELIPVLLNMYLEQQQNEKYHTIIMNANLCIFLGTILREYEATVEYPRKYYDKSNPIPKILNFVRKDLKNVSLESCANHFHFNQNYLSNLIKKHTGKSFLRFLNNIKIEEACKLILEQDIPITTLAERLGYENASYFSKVFKQYTGYSPKKFRNLK